MHHVHISTPVIFFTLLFLAAIVTVVFAFLRSMKRDRQLADIALERAKHPTPQYRFPDHDATSNDGRPYRSYGAAAPQAPVSHAVGYVAPTYTSPVYTAPAYAPGYGMDPGLALIEGMLIGEALGESHNHTTIINEGPSSYVDSTPSYDSGPSYDSVDSGVSYDSGSSSCDFGSSSGGFDASW